MKQARKWIGYALFVLILAGCSAAAHIEKDNNTDFSNYHSFAWIDKDGEGKQDSNRSNDLTEQQLRNAVAMELEKSGWKENKNKPDVLLSYDVLIERKTEESTSPVYSMPQSRLFYNPYSRRYFNVFYPSQFMGYESDQRLIREGTVTITMIDAKTDKTVWQGWTTDAVKSSNLTSKEIQNSVRSIFKKFDVARN
jgi:hypothetical protein